MSSAAYELGKRAGLIWDIGKGVAKAAPKWLARSGASAAKSAVPKAKAYARSLVPRFGDDAAGVAMHSAPGGISANIRSTLSGIGHGVTGRSLQTTSRREQRIVSLRTCCR